MAKRFGDKTPPSPCLFPHDSVNSQENKLSHFTQVAQVENKFFNTQHRPKSCFVIEDFTLVAKTGCGRTVSNFKWKGIPNDGRSYRKTARPKT